MNNKFETSSNNGQMADYITYRLGLKVKDIVQYYIIEEDIQILESELVSRVKASIASLDIKDIVSAAVISANSEFATHERERDCHENR